MTQQAVFFNNISSRKPTPSQKVQSWFLFIIMGFLISQPWNLLLTWLSQQNVDPLYFGIIAGLGYLWHALCCYLIVYFEVFYNLQAPRQRIFWASTLIISGLCASYLIFLFTPAGSKLQLAMLGSVSFLMFCATALINVSGFAIASQYNLIPPLVIGINLSGILNWLFLHYRPEQTLQIIICIIITCCFQLMLIYTRKFIHYKFFYYSSPSAVNETATVTEPAIETGRKISFSKIKDMILLYTMFMLTFMVFPTSLLNDPSTFNLGVLLFYVAAICGNLLPVPRMEYKTREQTLLNNTLYYGVLIILVACFFGLSFLPDVYTIDKLTLSLIMGFFLNYYSRLVFKYLQQQKNVTILSYATSIISFGLATGLLLSPLYNLILLKMIK